MNPILRTILITGFNIDDKLFIEYGKWGIINALLQKPIRLDSLHEQVNSQLQTYNLQKQKSLIKMNVLNLTSLL